MSQIDPIKTVPESPFITKEFYATEKENTVHKIKYRNRFGVKRILQIQSAFIGYAEDKIRAERQVDLPKEKERIQKEKEIFSDKLGKETDKDLRAQLLNYVAELEKDLVRLETHGEVAISNYAVNLWISQEGKRDIDFIEFVGSQLIEGVDVPYATIYEDGIPPEIFEEAQSFFTESSEKLLPKEKE